MGGVDEPHLRPALAEREDPQVRGRCRRGDAAAALPAETEAFARFAMYDTEEGSAVFILERADESPALGCRNRRPDTRPRALDGELRRRGDGAPRRHGSAHPATSRGTADRRTTPTRKSGVPRKQAFRREKGKKGRRQVTRTIYRTIAST